MNFIKKNINELKYANYNPRKKLKPEDKEYQKIKKSIEEFGYVEPIIINKDNTIIGGHQRLTVLKDLGYEEVEVIQIDIDKTKEKALNIALNKITGEWDYALLGDLLLDLDTQNYDLEITGFDLDEIENIMSPLGLEEEKEVIEDDFDCTPPEEPKAKYGDIYQLGNHYLMCGDSTKEEDVSKLMNGVKADMVFTDPPYGINIDNSNGKILGDGDLSVFNNSLKTINEFAKEDAHLYIYFGVQFIKECIEELKKYFKQTNILVQHITHENKPSPKGYFKNNYEMCYFSNRKDKDFNYGLYDVSETTLEDKRYNGDGKLNAYKALTEIKATEHNLKAIHPTQKTINICAFYINISSNSDETVLDLFGGSGSTLIACEQLNRKCYMMELDPHYVDVIINRWETFTGKKAVKLN